MASKRHDFDRCTTSLQTDFTCLALYVLAFSLLRATQATRPEPVHILDLGAQGDMQILSPRDAWMRLFVQGGILSE